MADDDRALRIRLEGRAERLEAAAARYRRLARAAGRWWGWAAGLRALAAELRLAAAEEAAVAEALDFVAHRRVAEGWPAGSVLEAAAAARRWQAALRREVEGRLGPDASHRLEEDLLALERQVARAPRLVLPTRRWALAFELLPRSLEVVARVEGFGALLERLFRDAPDELRVPVEDAEALAAGWAPGRLALEEAFALLDRSDATGGTARALRRRAGRVAAASLAPGASGPAVVVHAEAWRRLAEGRLLRWLEPRLRPARVRPAEAPALLAWLARREAGLPGGPALAPARAALLELSLVLSGAARPSEWPWDRLEAAAVAADGDVLDPDLQALRESLSGLVRVASVRGPWVPPAYREPVTVAPPELPPRASLQLLVKLLRARV